MDRSTIYWRVPRCTDVNLSHSHSPGGTRFTVSAESPHAARDLASALLTALVEVKSTGHAGLVVVCIGTDRSTGDALGPLVGSMLATTAGFPGHVYGTLDAPVHAANLHQVIRHLEQADSHSLVVAVDACLGGAENVGHVIVAPGALRPGAGVNKNLPPIGDVHVTGVVNVSGFMEYFVLQNTRLGPVVKMARAIAGGIVWAARALEATAGTEVLTAAAGPEPPQSHPASFLRPELPGPWFQHPASP